MNESCAKCGAALAADQAFCGACGEPVHAAVVAEPASQTVVAEPPRRGFGRIAGIVAIVGGLVAAGVVGGIVLRSDKAGGGAGSPENAVRALISAVVAEDFPGAIDATAPGEIRVLGDLYRSLVAKAEEVGLLDGDNPFRGVDLDVQGLQLSTTPIASGIAKVAITGGTGSYKIDPSKLAAGPKIKKTVDELLSGVDPGALRGSQPIDTSENPFLVTIQRDGKWYFSPFYTIAEVLRIEAGAAAPSRATQTPKGADSPKAAMQAFFDAGAKLDFDAFLDSLPPNEVGAVYDYRALIRDAFSSLAEQTLGSFSITITSTRFREEAIDGRRTRVSVEELALRVDDDTTGTHLTAGIEGDCLTYTEDGQSDRICLSDMPGVEQFGHLIPNRLFFVAVKEAGGWYVSPIETFAANLKHAIDNLTARDVDTILEFFGSFG